MQQKMTSYISLKNNIPAVNGTGLISWTQPVHEVTEEYSTKMFSKEFTSFKKPCMFFVLAPQSSIASRYIS